MCRFYRCHPHTFTSIYVRLIRILHYRRKIEYKAVDIRLLCLIQSTYVHSVDINIRVYSYWKSSFHLYTIKLYSSCKKPSYTLRPSHYLYTLSTISQIYLRTRHFDQPTLTSSESPRHIVQLDHYLGPKKYPQNRQMLSNPPYDMPNSTCPLGILNYNHPSSMTLSNSDSLLNYPSHRTLPNSDSHLNSLTDHPLPLTVPPLATIPALSRPLQLCSALLHARLDCHTYSGSFAHLGRPIHLY